MIASNRQMNHSKRHDEILKGSSIVLIGTIGGYILNYLFKMIAGRYLGPSGFGILAIGISVLTVFANLSVMGFNEGFTRFISFYKKQDDYGSIKSIVKFGFRWSLLVGIGIALVLFLSSEWIATVVFKEPESGLVVKYFSLLIPFQLVFILFSGVMRGLKKMTTLTMGKNIIMWLFKIAGVLTLILLGLKIESFALVFFVALIMSSIYYIHNFKKESLFKGVIAEKSNSIVNKEFLQFSIPLILSNLVQTLRKRSDIIIIGIFLPAKDVGFYFAALPFAMILTVFLFSINRIMLPVVSEAIGSGDDITVKCLFRDFALISFQITLPVFLLIYFFAGDIIMFVYGKEFSQSIVLLKILAVGFFVNAISGSFGEFFKAYNKSKLNLYLSFIGASTNILLFILLIPSMGVIGAALSTSISLLAMVLMGIYFGHIVLRINVFSQKFIIMLVISMGCFAMLYILVMVVSKVLFGLIFLALICGYFYFILLKNPLLQYLIQGQIKKWFRRVSKDS